MRRAALVLVVAVAAAAAAGWVVWLRRGASPARDARSGTAESGTGALTTAQRVVSRTLLHLSVDDQGTIAAGTPLFLTVTLERPSSTARADEAWVDSLRFETPQGAAVPWPLRRLGAPQILDFANDPVSTKKLPADGRQDVQFTRVRFAIAPDATMDIAVGKHSVRAAAVVGGARLASADVPFGIAARPATALTSQEWEQIGRFHLEAGEFARAHEIARTLVEAADDTIGYVLLGDAFSGLGRHEEALAAYIEALASIAAADSDEPPDRILLAIERAHDRLESGR